MQSGEVVSPVSDAVLEMQKGDSDYHCPLSIWASVSSEGNTETPFHGVREISTFTVCPL
jgi:hypothetical protein